MSGTDGTADEEFAILYEAMRAGVKSGPRR
jgi:hypothetical protein